MKLQFSILPRTSYIETRVTTFINTKFKISDDQTNMMSIRLAANITEYHIISKLIYLRINIPKVTMVRQLYHEKNACKIVKIQHV